MNGYGYSNKNNREGPARRTGGGELKDYATANATREVDLDQLSELISTVSNIDIYGVLKGLVKVVLRASGPRPADLGYFRISVSSEGRETGEEVGGGSVANARSGALDKARCPGVCPDQRGRDT